MEILWKDLRYSARRLVRTPGFTLVAIATLALAIGATTAMFSVLNAVLFRALPFGNADEVVLLSSLNKGKPMPMSALDFIDYRDQQKSFLSVAQWDQSSVNLTGDALKPALLNEGVVGAH